MSQLFTVTALNEYVSGLLAADPFLSDVRVAGEISGFKRHSSGHLYFSLKDDGALVKCVMFRQSAMALKFAPADGMRVVLTGYASLYQRDGSFQLYARSLEKQGQGELYLKFLELKARLDREGLFDPAHKRKPPFLPRCVGVVTSGTGAALQDVLNIISRRFPAMHVCVCPVRVQGAGAAAEIAAGIRALNEESDADVLIVGRGGGSMEDLFAFNEPEVARAIYGSRVPVISAVGHETDFTIADFVADLRAPTPSAAAELAVPEYSACMETVSRLSLRLGGALTNDLSRRRDAVRLRLLSPGFSLPARRVDELILRVDAETERLAQLSRDRLTAERQHLLRLGDRLTALEPRRVLARGFAYLTDTAGRAVPAARDVSAGQSVRAHLADGSLTAVVTTVDLLPEGE